MSRYDPRLELAPRDVVSRAILSEMASTGAPHVWLDLTHLDPARVEAHFPNISRTCRRYGIEITRNPIPVAPAAHYMIGGVRTDVCGRTSLPGLYACGEVASTGVHGANRLASNSLLEAVVFSQRIVNHQRGTCDCAGLDAAPQLGAPPVEPRTASPQLSVKPGGAARLTTPRLRQLLWERVGIRRDGAGLHGAIAQIERWQAAGAPRLNPRWVERANNIHVAALAREESRGAHFREDFPEPHDRWKRRLSWRLEKPQPLPL
jgi:L-aspartate oxidase